jgi:hypothetical protein
LGLLIAVFGFGLLRLFVLRFQAGDAHPPYSSLRSDPLGTAALYESLKEIPGVSVRRNFEPLHRTAHDPGATVIYLGAFERWAPPSAAPEEIFGRLERDGGRILMAFLPRQGKSAGCGPKGCAAEAGASSEAETRRRPAEKKDGEPVRRAQDPQKPPADLGRLLEERCGVRIVASSAPPREGKSVLGLAQAAAEGPPAAIPWHGGRHFEVVDPAWKVLYTQDGKPVIIERGIGPNGRLMLVAESYLFSNEALRRHRESALIAHLLGPAGDFVFDETHLGLIDQPTIARLIRLHGLHWFLITAAGLVLLTAWRRAAVLAPRADGGPAADAAPGAAKDSFHGWISLLRRNIGRGEILGVCIEEWSKTAGRESPQGPATVAEIKQAAREIDDPVKGYRRICGMISERKTHE